MDGSGDKIMRYKCIKEMYIQKYDDDGFIIDNEYMVVPVGSIWERDDRTNIMGGDVHLESIENKNDYGWIEITVDHLKENFVLVGN